MDLKSGNVYWLSAIAPPTPAPQLTADIACDVAIIGSGITGALLADRLAQLGLRVVVLDRRRRIVDGSTPASTGLLQYEIDTPLVDLIKKIGPDSAKRAYQRSFQSLADFRKAIAGLDHTGGMAIRPTLFMARDDDDADFLKQEFQARQEIGLPVELLSRDTLLREHGIDRACAIRSTDSMGVNAYQLASELLQRAQRHGARVYANATVAEYRARQSADARESVELSIDAPSRPRVRAMHVVFATGYETPEFLDQKICELHSTFAIASQPITDFGIWHDHSLIWEHADPYLYARTTPDNRVIVGGEDESFSNPEARDKLIEAKSKTLIEKFGALLPFMPPLRADFRWAGTFATTDDGLPFIGTTDQFAGGYFALGYGGNGITFSLIASQIIAGAITNQPDPDAHLFRFKR